MIGKIIVIFAIVLIAVFLITHTNLFYHPQTPVTKGEYEVTTTNVENIVSYQFSIISNTSVNYTIPLNMVYGNVTVEITGKGSYNLSILENSSLVYSTTVNGNFEKSFTLGGQIRLVFYSKQGIDVNVTVTDAY
ncbi:hypothetical protein V6M85_00935 [Sulfolobus tengchongensis]|uniref:Uncharacterized protein n=1 Tax=Sulfolobus tengchongensis TaxID=207809 RepID=A0AAX4L0Q2_9CREN